MISTLLWIPKGILCESPQSYEPAAEDVSKQEIVFEDEFAKEYAEQGDFMDAMMDEEMAEIDEADLNDEDDIDEDDLIKKSDHVLCVGKIGEVNSLEYQIFDPIERSLYIHRDIMLPSVPLSTAFVNPYVLISGFDSSIELWNTNYCDKLDPDIELKGHSDAVLSLDVNKVASNVVLSASADKTIKLWDVAKAKVVDTFNHHSDKVQAVKWHPVEATVYSSGGFDHNLSVGDTRSKSNFSTVNIGGEVECIDWGFEEYELISSNNNGEISCFDIRTMERLYTIGLTGECIFTKSLSKMLVIASPQDHVSSITIWKIDESPERLYMKGVDGNVLSIKSNPENPELIALGGINSQVWDLSCIKKLRKQVPELDSMEKRDEGIFTPYDFDEDYDSDEAMKK
eukprot:NODE_319_length_9908_cov_1.288001.p3 type:complete len:398 gc:universal NODE_319_length_9908_cov_1.288001:6609-7802(+)